MCKPTGNILYIISTFCRMQILQIYHKIAQNVLVFGGEHFQWKFSSCYLYRSLIFSPHWIRFLCFSILVLYFSSVSVSVPLYDLYHLYVVSKKCTIETRKYHRGASVPKQIWPLPGTKYCQRTKNRDFRQLTRVQWKNLNHIAGVVQIHCSNSYNAKYARRATSNQFWPLNYVWRNS